MSEIRQALSRDAVVAAALEIIDERGLDACTMRAVADAVGVEAMSLYWHVPSKEALLDGVVEMMLVEAEIGRADEEEWRARIAEFGRAFRRVLLRHPNALPLLAGRPFGAYTAAGRMTEDGIVSLRKAGFPSESAIRGRFEKR